MEALLPTISSAVYPYSTSAPWFQLVTVPSSVALEIASSEDATMEASKARDASASFRSVMSWKMADTATASPEAFKMALPEMDTLTLPPSLRTNRPSRWAWPRDICSVNGSMHWRSSGAISMDKECPIASSAV